MKALTLYQPWATLLAAGLKRLETRSWDMRHRGRLLVHAGQRWTKELELLSRSEPIGSLLRGLGYDVPFDHESRVWGGPPRGGLVGAVTVVECVPVERLHWAEAGSDLCRVGMGGGWQAPAEQRPLGDYRPGRFAAVCTDAVLFAEMTPLRGWQSVFDVPDSLVEGLL